MDCRTFHRKMEDYLQGGLDFAGRFGVERHAQQCISCERALRDASRLGQMARDLKRVTAPSDFESEVLARIQAVKARRHASMLWKWWVYGIDQVSWRALALGAASAAIVGLAIFLTIRYAGPDRLARSFPAAQGRAAFVSSDAPGGPATPYTLDSDPGRRGAMPYSADPRTISGLLQLSGAFPAGDPVGAYIDPADLGYVEYAIPGSGGRRLIMRLPKAIRVQYGQTSEDYFIRHVSH